MVRKLEHRQEDAFSLPAGSTSSSLIYLHDVLSNRRFLVDTGASISVFPASASPTSSGVQLLTANRSTLICSGSRIIPLCFGTWNCSWTFQLAPVSVPILGADFLQHHDLSVNLKNKKVFSNNASRGSTFDFSSSLPPSTSSMQAAFLTTPQCASQIFYRSFLMFCSLMDLLLLLHVIKFVIISSPRLDRQFLPKPAVYILPNLL